MNGGAKFALVGVSLLAFVLLIATNSYQDYGVVRAKVVDSLSIAESVKSCVEITYAKVGAFPVPTDDCRMISAGYRDFSKAPKIDINTSGVILITFGESYGPAAGRTLVLKPSAAELGKLTWSCSEGTLAKQYRPARCR